MSDLTPETLEFDPGRISIMSGWLVYDVGYHTCGGYGPESGYAHEPGCGAEPMCKVADIPDLLAAAIARHEQAWGVPAPEPTEPGPKGNPRLSARFVEWMMMLPAGWVTDVPGATRNQALKALGNGVVPPQAAAALRLMLNRIEAA